MDAIYPSFLTFILPLYQYMIILHTGRVGKQFFLWGESSAENEVPRVQRGRQPKDQVAKPYPYDSGFESLSSALEMLPVGTGWKEIENVNVWMQTIGGLPFPSSSLIAEITTSKAKITLAPWNVNAYLLETREAMDLLCACMEKRVLEPGIMAGNDLIWWVETLKFAGSMAAGQKYLPGIRVDEGVYRAFWEPLFTGEDAEELAKLAKQMPPVARALTLQVSEGAPEISALFVVRQFIADSLDQIVRSGAGKKQLSEKTHRTSFDSVHDAWVSALQSPEGLIHGDEKELLQLAARTHEWQRPLTILATSPGSVSAWRSLLRGKNLKRMNKPE